MKNYDLIIIGAGPVGIIVAKNAMEKGLSVLLVEKSKDLIKRRDLISGWFGKAIYDVDISSLELSKSNSYSKIIPKVIKDNNLFNYNLAHFLFESINKKVDILFNTEILQIEKNEQEFTLKTNNNSFKSKRCLIATGKYSIEWLSSLCASLNIIPIKNELQVGVRVEVPTFKIKDYIDVLKEIEEIQDIRINSFVGEWEETNMLSAYGYNTNKISHKTSFMLRAKTESNLEEIVKTIKIVNILANDRIKCERAIEFMEGKSILKHMEVFNVMKESLSKLESILPSFFTYAIIYIPEVSLSGILSVDKSMKTEIPNLYGAGECIASVRNLTEALHSGNIVSKTIIKEFKND